MRLKILGLVSTPTILERLKQLLLLLAGCITGVLAETFLGLYHALEPQVLDLLSKQTLLAGLGLSIVLNLLELTYYLLRLEKLDTGFKLKYGIYWDKDQNPHCPHCKTPVTYGDYADSSGYYCKPCNHVFGWSMPPGKCLVLKTYIFKAAPADQAFIDRLAR
jgi:hypothetical protein